MNKKSSLPKKDINYRAALAEKYLYDSEFENLPLHDVKPRSQHRYHKDIISIRGQYYFQSKDTSKEERKFSVNSTMDGVLTFDGAENWLLENHPDYFLGADILKDSGMSIDVRHLPKPSSDRLPAAQMGTPAGRYEYVKALAKERGLHIGPIEHDRDGERLNLKEGDVIKYVEHPDIKDKRVEVKFAVVGVTGKYPSVIYDMQVIESDGKRADSLWPEGKHEYFGTSAVGHYFSDIDCQDKHMYLVAGEQYEFEKDLYAHEFSADYPDPTTPPPPMVGMPVILPEYEPKLPKRRRRRPAWEPPGIEEPDGPDYSPGIEY